MPRSHWLDPLARRVLQATGQLPAPPKPALPQPEPIAPEPPAWVMDVNRASRDQWLQLPCCSQGHSRSAGAVAAGWSAIRQCR